MHTGFMQNHSVTDSPSRLNLSLQASGLTCLPAHIPHVLRVSQASARS